MAKGLGFAEPQGRAVPVGYDRDGHYPDWIDDFERLHRDTVTHKRGATRRSGEAENPGTDRDKPTFHFMLEAEEREGESNDPGDWHGNPRAMKRRLIDAYRRGQNGQNPPVEDGVVDPMVQRAWSEGQAQGKRR